MEEFVNTIIEGIILRPLNWVLLIACILLTKLYPKFRGVMGEFWVRVELKKLLKEEYKIINNVMIESNRNTHQIDHIVVSNYGIFVIEMKNYYGLITGKEYDYKWYQHFGKKKYGFKNPIHQNYGHIKALSEVLNLKEELFIPIICFSNQANLKISVKSHVIQLDGLSCLIKELNTDEQRFNLDEVVDKIEKLNIIDKSKKREHIKKIKEEVKKSVENENMMVCPRCGNSLVEQKGKYGKFVGCSGYPKCRYVKKL